MIQTALFLLLFSIKFFIFSSRFLENIIHEKFIHFIFIIIFYYILYSLFFENSKKLVTGINLPRKERIRNLRNRLAIDSIEARKVSPMSHSAPASRFRKITKHRGLGQQHVELPARECLLTSVEQGMIHSSQSFLFVATLLVAPLPLSPSFPSHDNFHRREGLLEENERVRERVRDSAPFGQRTTLRSLSNTRDAERSLHNQTLPSREGMTE